MQSVNPLELSQTRTILPFIMSRPVTSFALTGRISAGRTEITDHRHDIYRPEGLPAWTLNWTDAGVGRVEIAGHRRLTQVGELLLFPPQVFNDYGCDDATKHWVHLWSVFQPGPDWMPLLAWPEVLPGVYGLTVADPVVQQRIVAGFTDLIAAVRGPWPGRSDIAISILRTILLWAATAHPRDRMRGLDPRIAEAVRLCCAEPERIRSVVGLARRVGMSSSRLAHRFRTEVGLSPMAYAEQQRVLRACDLLRMTGRPIATIAEECGFIDPAYFARRFRIHTHMTPRAYRQGRR